MNILIWYGTVILKNMRSYTVKISRKAQYDVEDLTDFLLSVMSKEGARRYLDMMIAEIMSLSVFAGLYRPSPMVDIRRYHPKACRMVSHNKRWVYIFHIEDEVVIVDRIRPEKAIAK